MDPIQPSVRESDRDASSAALSPRFVRSLPVVIVAGAAAIAGLRAAAVVVVPVILSVLIAYALEPAVAKLVSWRVPRALAAIVVYAAAALAVFALVAAAKPQVESFVDELPEAVAAVRNLTADARSHRSSNAPGPIDNIADAARTVSRATVAERPAEPGVTRVSVVGRPFDVRGFLVSSSSGVASTAASLFTVALLTFLLLATGDLYKRKILRLAGRTLADRKVTLDVVRSIDRQIELYLLVRLAISAVVAVATTLAMWLLGVDHALTLGLAAGALNVLPFVGPAAGIALCALAALVTFKTLTMAAAAAGAALLVAALEGNALTPWLTGRAGELNTVAVFVGVLFWGWMWNLWGLLLAIPIMVTVKAAADRIEPLQPLGELLGR